MLPDVPHVFGNGVGSSRPPKPTVVRVLLLLLLLVLLLFAVAMLLLVFLLMMLLCGWKPGSVRSKPARPTANVAHQSATEMVAVQIVPLTLAGSKCECTNAAARTPPSK